MGAGIFLALVYELTGSLVPSIVFHICYNGCTVLFFIFIYTTVTGPKADDDSIRISDMLGQQKELRRGIRGGELEMTGPELKFEDFKWDEIEDKWGIEDENDLLKGGRQEF
jgi:hypothetical protein